MILECGLGHFIYTLIYRLLFTGVFCYLLMHFTVSEETEIDNFVHTMQVLSECNDMLTANTTILILHQPSMSDAPEDMDHQDKSSDVVLTESSTTNFPNNLQMQFCDASTDTNLQEKSDAVIAENRSTSVSDRECPSIPEDQIDAVDKDSSNMEISGNLHC